MPWKEAYTSSNDRSLTDSEVSWPDNHRCCATFVVDLSLASKPEGLVPTDLARKERVTFGLQEGLDRLLALFRRFEIKATFAVPAIMAEPLRARIDTIISDNHEVAVHSFKHEDLSTLAADEEKRRIDLSTEIFHKIIGEQPSGWYSLPRQTDEFATGAVSRNTINLLVDAGYQYFGNGLADDIPYYWVTDFDSEKSLLTMPYYYHYDDQFFLLFPPQGGSGMEHSDTLFANWMAEFNAQYQRGRFFSMTLHPHSIGWCNRFILLERFLTHLREQSDVWNPTSRECATYWQKAFPASTTLNLQPTIWQDYEGSLS
jgi:peptidoglycan-N-acetylglucosamine deacetylase